VGALLGLCCRLLLIVPADLIGRLLASRANPALGTISFWQSVPGSEDGFLRAFVLATWWLGGAIALGLVWKRGGRGADLFCGAVAGVATGLAVCAILGCSVVLLDEPARLVLGTIAGGAEMSAGLATLLWLLTVCGWWVLLGALVGQILAGFGSRGLRNLARLAAPLAWLCRLCGLPRAADWLT
jgi:hypothetical protein